MPKKKKRPEPEHLETPFPSYNLARVFSQKRKIQQKCADFVGMHLRTSLFERFVSQVRESLPSKGRGIEDDVLARSLRHLVSSPLTQEELATTAWRLAGNIRHLKNCSAVTPWGRQVSNEWVPVQVMLVTLRWANGKYGATFRLKFLAGSTCPLTVFQFWTHRFCAVFAGDLGFSKPWNRTPYADPRQFFGMRFYVKIEPELCGEHPGFHELRVPSGCRSWNQNLLRMRYRTDPDFFSCPLGYHEDYRCHVCAAGTEHCPAALHPRTFIRRRCGRCRNDQAWFDPSTKRRICVECFHALRRKGEL